MNLFFQVVLPVITVFLLGFALQKKLHLDIKSLSTVALYIFVPFLILQTIYDKDLDVQYLHILIFSLLFLFALIVLAKIFAKIRRYSLSKESGLILSTAFMNSGNYGAPIILFAFGETGFTYAIMFFVLQAILMNFFGIYYAARGTSGIKIALQTVFKMPPTYALLLGLIIKWLDVTIPDNVYSLIDLLASAAIPLVMIILGAQLAEIKVKGMEIGKIGFGVLTRLVFSPLIAVAILLLIPMDPLLEKVLIVTAAMPTAATTTMYAVQFDAEPQLVSSITLVTTLMSVFTITGVLVLVG